MQCRTTTHGLNKVAYTTRLKFSKFAQSKKGKFKGFFNKNIEFREGNSNSGA